MKHSTVGVSGVSVVLVASLVLGFIVVQPALAQVATTSIDSTTSTTSEPTALASSDQATTSPDSATSPTAEGTSTATVDASSQTSQGSEASTPTRRPLRHRQRLSQQRHRSKRLPWGSRRSESSAQSTLTTSPTAKPHSRFLVILQ